MLSSVVIDSGCWQDIVRAMKLIVACLLARCMCLACQSISGYGDGFLFIKSIYTITLLKIMANGEHNSTLRVFGL